MSNDESIDFGNPLTHSALDRDEAECLDNYGSIQNLDVSFSGILASTNLALNFMPEEDSLFQSLRREINLVTPKEDLSILGDSGIKMESASSLCRRDTLDQISGTNFNSTRLTGLPKIAEIAKMIRNAREENPKASISDIENVLGDLILTESKVEMPVSAKPSPEQNDLLVESTHKVISWPSVQLGESMMCSCTIRLACRDKSEDLIIAIPDEVGGDKCFKFLHYQNMINEFTITLGPLQMYELNVLFIPEKIGQFASCIVIRRTTPGDKCKRCIALYGYGGLGHICLNIGYDVNTKTAYLHYDAKLQSAKFLIKNIGSDILFFIISAYYKVHSHHEISVTPQFGRIRPGEEVTVIITCPIVENLFDTLLQGGKRWLVKIAEVSMIFGDEASRLRISRLHRKYQHTHQDTFAPHAKVLERILNLKKNSSCCVNKLKDDVTSFHLICDNGINKWKADIVAKRSAFNYGFRNKHLNYQPLEDILPVSEESGLPSTALISESP